MVSRCRLVGRGGLVGRLGVAGVLDIGDVARVVISDSVGDSLGAAVGEEDVVLAVGGIAVTVLLGAEEDTVVVILGINTVLVGVEGGGLLVGRSRGIGGRGAPLVDSVVSGGGLVSRGRLVGRGGGSFFAEARILIPANNDTAFFIGIRMSV